MRSSSLRTVAALALTSLATTAVTAVGAAPGMAVIATDTVTFTDCEVDRNDVPLPGETSWSPTFTIDHPSPAPVASAQTVEVVLSSLPAGTFPEDYPAEVDLEIVVGFEDGRGSTFEFEASRPLASFQAGAPLVVGEFETDLTFFSSGVHDFKPKSVRVELFGIIDQDTFDYVTYQYECDQVVDAEAISQVRVYDPAAAASIRLDRLAARQGGAVVISGQDFPREAVEDPDLDVSVFVGAVLAGSFDVDDIGQIAGVVRIPAFARPGAPVTVRATAPDESATAPLNVRARAAAVRTTSSVVRPGAMVVVNGSSLKPGETARILLTRAGSATGTKRFSATAKVGASGTFTKTVRLARAAKGGWKVRVTGPQSFRSATARFRVR